MRRLKLTTLLSCLLALPACGNGGSAVEERPNVLLICIDALRADRLGAYGARNGPTPALDSLAGRAVVFKRAYSVASWTKPAVPSLLTGLYPAQHGVMESASRGSDLLPERVETLAEQLGQDGYRTAAFVENEHLRKRYGRLDQGFEYYAEEAGNAPSLAHRFLNWLTRTDGSEPFFAYLHFLDPHWPYTPDDASSQLGLDPELRFKQDLWALRAEHWWLLRERVAAGKLSLPDQDVEALRELYDGEVFATDSVIGRLLEWLDADGVFKDTLVIVTSDHGEGFLEHGRLDHGYGLYEELLRVPLIMRFPGDRFAGSEVGGLVQIVDVVPTVLDYLGLSAHSAVFGRSLLRAIKKGSTAPDRKLLAQERHGKTSYLALYEGRYKYVRTRNAYAPSPPLIRIVPEALQAGARVQAEGMYAGGRIVAGEVKRIQPGDKDLELQGPVASAPTATAMLTLLGFKVDIANANWGSRLAGATFNPAEIHRGRWIRVDGKLEHGRFMARKIQSIDATEAADIEVEGVVTGLEALPDGDLLLDISGVAVYVDPKAYWKNFPAERREIPVPDPVTRPQPYDWEGVYDLRSPGGQSTNLAEKNPQLLDTMSSDAEFFERRLKDFGVRSAETVELDAAMRDRLRELGYLK